MAEPTYYTGVLASVAGANKHHLTLWNVAGSGKTLKLRKIAAAGAPAAAVTGLVIALYAARITTQPTGGTVPVIRKAVASDAALPAGIEVKAAPTGGASPEAEPFGVGEVSGEETVAPGYGGPLRVHGHWGQSHPDRRRPGHNRSARGIGFCRGNQCHCSLYGGLMATFRLKAEITLPAIQDAVAFRSALQDQLDDIGPVTFGAPGGSGQNITLDAGFLDQIDRDTLYEWLTTFLGGGTTGRVSIHQCSHGAGEAEGAWTGCKEVSAGYEETNA